MIVVDTTALSSCFWANLKQTILRYFHFYNSQLPQSALKGQMPIDALKDLQRQRPELFRKRVYNHLGCDS